jgi:hypothetical protein
MLTVLAGAPRPPPSFSSVVSLRLSVMRRGSLPLAGVMPDLPRCVSSAALSAAVTGDFSLSTLTPACFSWASSRSTGIFSSVAKSWTVVLMAALFFRIRLAQTSGRARP